MGVPLELPHRRPDFGSGFDFTAMGAAILFFLSSASSPFPCISYGASPKLQMAAPIEVRISFRRVFFEGWRLNFPRLVRIFPAARKPSQCISYGARLKIPHRRPDFRSGFYPEECRVRCEGAPRARFFREGRGGRAVF